MLQRLSNLCSIVLIAGVLCPPLVYAQSRTEVVGDCGSAICIKTGDGNWKYVASDYCDSEVCLQDGLESIASLRWDRMPAGYRDLVYAVKSPFVGLSDAEYQQLKDYGEDNKNLPQRVELLAKAGVTCEVSGFTLRLDIPGRDIVIVTFGAAAASSGGSQEFQVVSIDRTFRDLPGGSMGWWIRLVNYRYPGIVRLDGDPVDIASYETGLYASRLLLHDKGFEYGTAEEYATHQECANR